MIDRRAVTRGILGAGIAALGRRSASALAAAASAPSAIVKTSAGSVEGLAQGNVFAFLGVPYGAPTGGEARFMPPRPPAAWAGVRAAKAYGDSCPQVPLGLTPFAKKRSADEPPPAPTPMQKQLATLFARNRYDQPQGEDCLVLNVWTRAPDSAKRPVMVWLHGGGFAVGSGSSPTYAGARLAGLEDVVVVTINHRLNTFGYLYLGDIAGDAFAQSGNVGMLDIVSALEWVRDNIAGFGGDPGNVTLFGESGGAGKVSVMCAIPAAKGLFHKAIMQSGPCLQIADKARGTAIAKQLLEDLGLSVHQIGELQRFDAAKLAAAAAPVFVYVLGWEVNPDLRSPHGTDVALVFETIDSSPAIAAAVGAQAVSDQMSAAWAAFARAGNPNTSKIPHWPAYSLGSRPNLLFDVTSRVVPDYGRQAREFWERAT
jgi:para-nitrobenzyl esterase